MDKKKIINIAAIVIGGFIAYKLITKKSDSGTSDNGGGNGGGGNGGGNGGGGNGGGNGTGLNYTSLANDLFAAFDGYGTDESSVIATFSLLKSDKDFDELVKAYGIREISSGKWNPQGNFTSNLVGAIKSEMSTSYIAQINSILKSNGISKQIV